MTSKVKFNLGIPLETPCLLACWECCGIGARQGGEGSWGRVFGDEHVQQESLGTKANPYQLQNLAWI